MQEDQESGSSEESESESDDESEEDEETHQSDAVRKREKAVQRIQVLFATLCTAENLFS